MKPPKEYASVPRPSTFLAASPNTTFASSWEDQPPLSAMANSPAETDVPARAAPLIANPHEVLSLGGAALTPPP